MKRSGPMKNRKNSGSKSLLSEFDDIFEAIREMGGKLIPKNKKRLSKKPTAAIDIGTPNDHQVVVVFYGRGFTQTCIIKAKHTIVAIIEFLKHKNSELTLHFARAWS